jgi:hypothetical protein
MNSNGRIALFKQYLKNGVAVVAKNLNRFVCKIKVVTFQLIIKTPNATPVNKAPHIFTLPRYSGEKNKASAPKFFKKPLLIVLASMYQKKRSIWNFRKWRINSCMGKE